MSDHQELLQRIAGISQTAKFNQWLDLKVAAVAPGEVELHLRWREEFGQYAGYLHAALIGGLIDTACGFAAATMVGRVLTTQFSVRCLRPAVAETFVVRGRVVKPGKQQVFAAAELFALDGDPQKPFAMGDALLVPVVP